MPWVNRQGETAVQKYRRQYLTNEQLYKKHKTFNWQLFRETAPLFGLLQEYAKIIVEECEKGKDNG